MAFARSSSRSEVRRPLGRGLRLGRGFARARRAQVILVAVMVLFGVATLAALFIGILGAQIVQVTRYADVTALRAAAEAGLRLANHNLVYSKEGADWRPALLTGTQEPLPYRSGTGLVRVRVAYGPTPTDLQSRYLLISSTATFPNDPFVSYTVLGVKPLLLTEYARAITDRYELRQPAALGVAGVEALGEPRTDTLFSITGGIRSNTDLVWYGPSQVRLGTPDGMVNRPPNSVLGITWADLGLLRDDRIEVAGTMRSALPSAAYEANPSLLDTGPLRLFLDTAAQPWIGNVFRPATASEQLAYTIGFPLFDDVVPRPNSWRVLAELPPFNAGGTLPGSSNLLVPGPFAVPRIQPPRMDALEPDLHTNRYLALTRDSGLWRLTSRGYVNSGASGWGWAYGGGIYLDNDTDIQYEHDLEKLRQNWVGSYYAAQRDRPSGSIANWWDKSGRYYAPPGAEIVLHGEAACPYLEITRDDLRTRDNTVWYAWTDMNDAPIAVDGAAYQYQAQAGMCSPAGGGELPRVEGARAIFPFPPNGVIYAEGNVRVRGVVPPNRHARANMPYFGTDYNATGNWGRSRHYDLSIVSGGTIYVEGDLLSPVGAGLAPAGMTDAADLLQWDMLNGSRVALIARDHVCLNTTALHPRPANLLVRDAHGNWEPASFNDNQRLYPERDPLTDAPRYPLSSVPITDGVPEDGDPRDGPIYTAPISFIYHNVRFDTPLYQDLIAAQLGLIIGHSGWYLNDDAGDTQASVPDGGGAEDAQVTVGLHINNDLVPWPGNQEEYTFAVTDTPNLAQSLSDHWYLESTRLPFSAENNYLEFLFLPGRQPSTAGGFAYALAGRDTITFEPALWPVWNHNTDNPQWIVKPHQLGYVLGPVAAAPVRGRPPLPVLVEAMVYAQNGSWFILPGPWFGEDPDETPGPTATPSPYPVYHEPLNMQIRFRGAITENMPAPIGDVAEWTSKWAGALGTQAAQYAPYLSYEYDPLLRAPRWEQVGLCPRFPRLPLSPDVVIWGERVAGFSTAGV